MDELDLDREALLQTFLAEAEEIFVRMEQGLVALEARPGDDEILHGLFREAHTLKGSAGLLAFDAVRDLAHDLEDVLERVRKRTLGVSGVLVTLLLRSVDVLRGAVSEGAAGSTAASEAALAFRRLLAETAAGAAAPARARAADPAPEPGSPGAGDELPEPALHHAGGGRTLRVDVARLDRMLDLSGEIAQGAGEQGQFAPYSWWPLALGFSAALLFAGLAAGWWLFLIGLPLGILSLVGWVFEYHRGEYAH